MGMALSTLLKRFLSTSLLLDFLLLFHSFSLSLSLSLSLSSLSLLSLSLSLCLSLSLSRYLSLIFFIFLVLFNPHSYSFLFIQSGITVFFILFPSLLNLSALPSPPPSSPPPTCTTLTHISRSSRNYLKNLSRPRISISPRHRSSLMICWVPVNLISPPTH